MAQPIRLADLLPAALDAFRAPHLTRVPVASPPYPAPAASRDDARTGLSHVLVRVDATLRRAA